VPTSHAAFLGFAQKQPTRPGDCFINSYAEFRREYGDGKTVTLADGTAAPNTLAHAVRGFFDNGGTHLNVQPVETAAPEAFTEAMARLADIPDVSLVAAPSAATIPDAAARLNVYLALTAHAQSLRRFAILPAPDTTDLAAVRGFRASFDTPSAAIYHPWLRVAGTVNPVPPDGHIAGIFARSDRTRGVHKAPANEIIRGIRGFASTVTTSLQDVLNPEGINCLRAITGRGRRVWGARTVSSDPEWKYISVRRLCTYFERSIERGTQWAVYEPNAQPLWAAVRREIEDFLHQAWRSGALHGTKPEEAYFVRCDRSTMTQTDIDNGRLICLVGVAPVRPAEFVIFRIGQWTADHQG
jgi:hypothetical protein